MATNGCKCINRKLLPLKIGMFLWWGGQNALFAFMSVHMRTLGLTASQTGIIHSFLPVAQVTGQLGMGALADRFRKHKFILTIALTFAAVAATAILHVPAMDISGSRSVDVTFYSYLFLRLLFELCTATTFNMFESIAMILVTQNPGADFGSQRTFATLGAGTFPLLAGLMLDLYRGPEVASIEVDLANGTLANGTIANGTMANMTEIIYARSFDFTALFYFFDLTIIGAIIICIIWFKVDDPKRPVSTGVKQSPVKTLFYIAIKPEASIFIFTVLCLGSCWGYTKIFVPWRMAELGSDQLLIGIGLFISTLLGLILVILSEPIIKYIGHVPIMTLSFLAYTTRFWGYSVLETPEYFLIFEGLEGITYHLLWVACVTYAALFTPPNLIATVLGFLGSLHYCIGLGIGGLIGGSTIGHFGPEIAFRGMAVTSFTCAVSSALFYFVYTRRYSRLLSVAR